MAGRKFDSSRRNWLRTMLAAAGVIAADGLVGATSWSSIFTLVTFGDSILDCARYNEFGVHPGQLIVRNDDDLFPEFEHRDLFSLGLAHLDHRAVDGATVSSLPRQAQGLLVEGPAVALVAIGGNDLIEGLAADRGGEGIQRFKQELDAFLHRLPIRPILLGNVYDPTFGDDSRNFLTVDASIARPNFNRVNAVIKELAPRYGQFVDLHQH
ncbi:MAG TPA: SGNH/GDSL hydrolase family protein, partial [Nitrosospira sp.]|nr:SGNH/GDSL hydrolase family protein [Nitrosospira sp.]